jgi:hypothetical protein
MPWPQKAQGSQNALIRISDFEFLELLVAILHCEASVKSV